MLIRRVRCTRIHHEGAPGLLAPLLGLPHLHLRVHESCVVVLDAVAVATQIDRNAPTAVAGMISDAGRSPRSLLPVP